MLMKWLGRDTAPVFASAGSTDLPMPIRRDRKSCFVFATHVIPVTSIWSWFCRVPRIFLLLLLLLLLLLVLLFLVLLLLLLMLAISSSASVAVLLHSQGGGGDVMQSQGVELTPAGWGLVGFDFGASWGLLAALLASSLVHVFCEVVFALLPGSWGLFAS